MSDANQHPGSKHHNLEPFQNDHEQRYDQQRNDDQKHHLDQQHDDVRTNEQAIHPKEESDYIRKVAADEVAASTDPSPEPSSKWNQVMNSAHIEQAKKLSSHYWRYWIRVLQQPFASLKEADEKHFPHALMTMGLIAVLFPLFIVLSSFKIGLGFAFVDMILKPLIYTLLAMVAAVASIVFISHGQGTSIHYKKAAAQYATLLVPVPACIILTILAALIGLGVTVTSVLIAASFLFMIIATNMVVLRHPGAKNPKLDHLYSLVIANMVIGFFLYRLVVSTISVMVKSFFLF